MFLAIISYFQKWLFRFSFNLVTWLLPLFDHIALVVVVVIVRQKKIAKLGIVGTWWSIGKGGAEMLVLGDSWNGVIRCCTYMYIKTRQLIWPNDSLWNTLHYIYYNIKKRQLIWPKSGRSGLLWKLKRIRGPISKEKITGISKLTSAPPPPFPPAHYLHPFFDIPYPHARHKNNTFIPFYCLTTPPPLRQ